MERGATGPYVSSDDLADARARIAGRVHRTPTMSASRLGARWNLRLSLKAELFQKTGSFKVRGVLNRLDHLTADERRRGLVSMSAGNHAAALAWAAAAAGTTATIVMPADALESKIEATRAYGGEIVLTHGDLMQGCAELQQSRGLTFIHPFDDPAIIAGHGSVGWEIVEDRPEVDVVIVPIGGGGLISGVAAAVKMLRPEARVVGVEPTGADAMSRSLEQGRPVHLDRRQTIADGLAAPFVGEHNLRHVQRFVDDVVRVEDATIIEALRLILTRAKLAAEPSGAAALAALVSGAVQPPAGADVVCVVSGGNLDPDRLRELL